MNEQSDKNEIEMQKNKEEIERLKKSIILGYKIEKVKRLSELVSLAAAKAAYVETVCDFLKEETPDTSFDISYKAIHFAMLSKKFKDRMYSILDEIGELYDNEINS